MSSILVGLINGPPLCGPPAVECDILCFICMQGCVWAFKIALLLHFRPIWRPLVVFISFVSRWGQSVNTCSRVFVRSCPEVGYLMNKYLISLLSLGWAHTAASWAWSPVPVPHWHAEDIGHEWPTKRRCLCPKHKKGHCHFKVCVIEGRISQQVLLKETGRE